MFVNLRNQLLKAYDNCKSFTMADGKINACFSPFVSLSSLTCSLIYLGWIEQGMTAKFLKNSRQ